MLNFIKKTIKNIFKSRYCLFKYKFKSLGKNFRIGFGCRLYGEKYMSFGNDVNINNNCNIETYDSYANSTISYHPELNIGNDVTITNNCYISCINKISIGNGCLIGVNAYISDNFHGSNKFDELDIIPNKRNLFSKGGINIGKNVWVGRNVCIMPNVTIGDFAIIGANAVVTHDIPKYAIAAGVPAKVITIMKTS